jgi:membrane-bound ClpP family serine protease
MISALLAQVATAPEPAVMSVASAIAWAVALLVLAAALAVVEFLVVSWGMLLVGSVISAIAAVALAFQANTTVGWIFIGIVPVLAYYVCRSGFSLMRRNSAAVMPTELTEDAGVRHTAERAGVAIGALGEMTTNAFPTGRARFSGAHGPVVLDVQVQGPVLSSGDRVVILAISGPSITVGAAPDTVSSLIDTNSQHAQHAQQGSSHA